MPPLWILCGLFGKKASRERLASRISALLDITLNDDDGLLNLRCAKCTEFRDGDDRSAAVLQSELSLHAIVLS